MSIIDSLKQIIGYSGTDLDVIFAIIAVYIVIFFVFSLFNLLNSVFRI